MPGDGHPPKTSPLTPSSAPTTTSHGEAPTPLPVASGQVLGDRYRIRRLLGRGGMGEVWHADDLKLRVEVALKALPPELVGDERRRELLRGEVRSAREVISPNVCRIYDLVEVDDQELVSMEYIDGQTLLGHLKDRGPLELREAGEIASQFLAGLEAIHQAGLVHRDVKPENVMLTRSGRVVVMDFGIAKPMTEGEGGTIAGTPAYMAPEQLRGEAPDARSDLFSAGVVLAEMVGAERRRDRTTCETLWRGVRRDPPELPESPWRPVLVRAVAADPRERPPSARSLARALEEQTLRMAGAEDVRPYPGLSSFTEADAEYFFGREQEVEEIWKKLRRPHLLALVGPSGAGKSSFLRAGLLPAMPEGWQAAVCTPGNRPFMSLARAFTQQLAGDPEALQLLLEFENPDTATEVAGRWRKRHSEALVVVDQFEELFTLCPEEVQGRFAELLGRLALEADVHVLLSMRDDFLLRCHDLEPLTPIFSELTPLKPPRGPALRRALVQPAWRCGYRFEDEALADEMLAEVREERGALPLLAFAAAQLWERRDRDEGLLTRGAYEEIGGVAGALARHADATLERIGSERGPLVRELFRNLVTAEGTRAVREWDELLSVFGEEERPAAEGALRALVDARLLTSYEEEPETEGTSGRRRVEIIHESLLSAWPRLVRWRTQDEDSAQLRDQLRQAAQLWEERGRPDDLLWTGTSYREAQIWRERYPGGLSSVEEAFNRAMVRRAARRRRRRRVAVTTAFALLVGIVAVVGSLWRRAEIERDKAEAARLMALAEMENTPTALAYALASLELVDDPRVRRFVVATLWRGPTPLVLEQRSGEQAMLMNVAFSSDGRRLAVASGSGIRVWDSGGGEPISITDHECWWVFFGPEPDRLISGAVYFGDGTVRVWSVPDGREIRRIQFDEQAGLFTNLRGQIITDDADLDVEQFPRWVGDHHFQSWPLESGEPTTLGRLTVEMGSDDGGVGIDVDPTGTRLAFTGEREVYVIPFEEMGSAPPRLVARHDHPISRLVFHPDGDRLGIMDTRGEIRILSLAGEGEAPVPVLQALWDGDFGFDDEGSRLAVSGHVITQLLDLEGPLDTQPLVFGADEWGTSWDAAFHPGGRWIATINNFMPALWPLARTYPRVVEVEPAVLNLVFAPDGSWLAFSAGSEVRRWPLTATQGERSSVLFKASSGRSHGLAMDPGGRHLLMGLAAGHDEFMRPKLLSLEDGSVRDLLENEAQPAMAAAFGPEGRLAAVGFGENEAVIRVWDLESGEVRILEPEQQGGWLRDLQFLSDRRLVSAGDAELRLWDLATGESELLREGAVKDIDSSRDGRHLVAATADGVIVYDLEAGTSRSLETGESPVRRVALDPTGTIVVAGHEDSAVSVGPLAGGDRHLLLGHKAYPTRVAVSPDGRWIASAGADGTVRLWPMPDMDQPPFHTLPHEELLERLRSLTNLRFVPDPEAEDGYRLRVEPFPGWETVPTW